MTQPTQKDQISIGINRLLEQFKDKPNIVGILTSYLDQLDDLELMYFDLLNERSVFTAIGVQLDVIGALVNEARLGKNDEEYRIAILTRVGINNAEGTPNQIMAVLKSLTSATKVNMWEHFPVSAIYYTNTEVGANNSLANTVQTISPATSGNVVIIFDPEENAFLPNEVEIDQYFIIDNEGNFLIDDEGDYLVSKESATTSSEGYIYGVLSEVIPEFLTVGQTTTSTGAGEPLMQAGEPTAEAANSFLEFLEIFDGTTLTTLEIWSDIEIERSIAPYGVLPEIKIAN